MMSETISIIPPPERVTKVKMILKYPFYSFFNRISCQRNSTACQLFNLLRNRRSVLGHFDSKKYTRSIDGGVPKHPEDHNAVSICAV